MIICHIGSYNRNLGDNIALLNVRRIFEKNKKNINWISINISSFWEKKNDIKYCKNFFTKSNYDAIVVGGGGLIEYKGYEKMNTNWKLPFNKEILDVIKCPLFFVGVGINYFRGNEGFSKQAKNNLEYTIEKSTKFSLRNDGSFNILKSLNINSTKVEIIPDPGLIFNFEKEEINKIKNKCIQPAFNSNKKINNKRYLNSENIEKIKNFSNKNCLKTFPHTPKDYKYNFENYIIDKKNIMKELKFDNTINCIKKYYLPIDFTLALRGHGQLITIGLNIPGIYLSTQDKIKYFSLLNGFEDYNVDIQEDNWYEKLVEKFHKINNDSNYLLKWYKIRSKNIYLWKSQINKFIQECCQFI